MKTHQKRETREYEIWCGMKRRCLNPNRPDYKYYGGRGITVCKRWINSFQAFWDDMKCPAPAGATIERIDNSKGYDPSNCEWASRSSQGRNQRSNVLLTLNGETRNATDWAIHLGIPWQTIFNRIRRGYPVERVLSTSKFYGNRFRKGLVKT